MYLRVINQQHTLYQLLVLVLQEHVIILQKNR